MTDSRPRDSSMRSRSVVLYGGAAAIGGVLWAVKSLAILATGEQPDYIFMSAPFFFGIASIGISEAADTAFRTWLLKAVAWTATIAGAIAAGASLAGSEDGPFGASVAVCMLAVLVVMLWGGYKIRRSGSLGKWSFGPWGLAWLMLAALPIGGVLESVNERLLEVPLLLVGVAWIGLGTAMAVASPAPRHEASDQGGTFRKQGV